MSALVVVLLAVLWASILVPGLLRGRRHRSPASSIDAFERSMGILANDLRARLPGSKPPPGRQVLVVSDRARLVARPARVRALRRRRRVLQALVVATLLSTVAAALAGGWTRALPVAPGVALLAYVALLARVRARELDTRRTLRHLPAGADDASGQAPVGEDRLVAGGHQGGYAVLGGGGAAGARRGAEASSR